jgi:biotin transport system ATP-binding protein
MDIIEIENLSHRFENGTLGLDCINLQIREGAFVIVAGPNGSGKTTLIRHLNGLLLPTAGSVQLTGVSVQQVYEDVAFGPENLQLDRGQISKRVKQALIAVGLTDFADQSPHLLSGGEKRRLAIAGILAMEPKVIAFDEPFASLDYPGVKQVLQQILALHRSGHTILVVTHDLEKVIAHADRLIIMQKGQVVGDGKPAEIVNAVEAFGVRAPCASLLGMEVPSWLH